MSDGGFFGGFGKGVAAAAKGTWEGAKALAKSGHALATDAQAREQAWNGAKQMADTVRQYGAGAMQEPATVWRDARNTAAAAWTAFDEFRSTARPKEWGEVIGGGALEVGTAFIPIGAATKLAKAGSAVDKLADATRLAEKLPDAPLTCIGPCQAVTPTKRAMRLRDDLGPEHFDGEGQLNGHRTTALRRRPRPRPSSRGLSSTVTVLAVASWTVAASSPPTARRTSIAHCPTIRQR